MPFGIRININGGKREIEPFIKTSKLKGGVKIDFSKKKTIYAPYLRSK